VKHPDKTTRASGGRAHAAGGQEPLARRPGFLIRRLHQIHLAMFYEACEGFNVTPLQSSIMTVLAAHAALDQVTLAASIGVDRATIGQVVRRLAARGLIARGGSAGDKRLKLVWLTPAGRDMLDRIAPLTASAHARTLAALTMRERKQFVASLIKLVDADTERGRAPRLWNGLMPGDEAPPA
jgi:DNA-binding MarR family transcriptional regulator